MTALKVIGCIILFFALLLSLRISIVITYKENLKAYLRILFFKIRLYPKNEKKRGPHYRSKRKADKIWAQHKADEKSKHMQKLKKKRQKSCLKNIKQTVSDVLETLGLLKDLLSTLVSRIFKYLKIKLARMKINVATGDAATTAIAYGAVCEAVSVLLAILEPIDGFSTPSKKEVAVYADYLSENTTVDIKIILSVRVWQAIHVAIATLNTYVNQLASKKAINATRLDIKTYNERK